MNREFVKEWVEALRSDKYIQGRHQLKDGNCYCCLGVAVAIHPECNISDVWLEPKERNQFTSAFDDEFPCEKVMQDIGIPMSEAYEIAKLNDVQCLDFSEIADYLEGKLLKDE